jgi:hypothetical protein
VSSDLHCFIDHPGCKDVLATISLAFIAVDAGVHGLPWSQMPKMNANETTQETQPRTEILIPTRGNFFRDLRKVAQPRNRDSVPEDGEGRAEH